LHCSYQLERLAAASGGSKLREKTVALAVELTAIATVDDPSGQVISASQEDLPAPAECGFLPYLALATETWLAAW
jgi:hypothetical protein